jgi:hypothetical protein
MPASSQSRDYAPMVLQLPASARALALGDAWVGARDVDAVFYNPAQLAGGRAGTVASLERYGGASTAGSFATLLPLGPVGMGVGAQMIDFGTLSSRYPGAAPGSGGLTRGGLVNASSTMAVIGLAMPYKGIRWGLAGRFAEDRVEANRDGVALFDVGAGKEFFGQVTVGASIRNIGLGPHLGGTALPLPTRAALGMQGFGLPIGPFDFALNAEVGMIRFDHMTAGLGAELAWTPIEGITTTGRVGFRTPLGDQESPVTLGLGFQLDRFVVEYGWEGIQGPGSGHRIGFRAR